MSTTNSRAIYNAVYNGSIFKGVGGERAEKTAKRAEVRYLQNQYETPQALIETMIKESQNKPLTTPIKRDFTDTKASEWPVHNELFGGDQ